MLVQSEWVKYGFKSCSSVDIVLSINMQYFHKTFQKVENIHLKYSAKIKPKKCQLNIWRGCSTLCIYALNILFKNCLSVINPGFAH